MFVCTRYSMDSRTC